MILLLSPSLSYWLVKSLCCRIAPAEGQGRSPEAEASPVATGGSQSSGKKIRLACWGLPAVDSSWGSAFWGSREVKAVSIREECGKCCLNWLLWTLIRDSGLRESDEMHLFTNLEQLSSSFFPTLINTISRNSLLKSQVWKHFLWEREQEKGIASTLHCVTSFLPAFSHLFPSSVQCSVRESRMLKSFLYPQFRGKWLWNKITPC